MASGLVPSTISTDFMRQPVVPEETSSTMHIQPNFDNSQEEETISRHESARLDEKQIDIPPSLVLYDCQIRLQNVVSSPGCRLHWRRGKLSLYTMRMRL